LGGWRDCGGKIKANSDAVTSAALSEATNDVDVWMLKVTVAHINRFPGELRISILNIVPGFQVLRLAGLGKMYKTES
jgi:hypothetical protein